VDECKPDSSIKNGQFDRKVDECKPLVGGGAPGYDVVHLSARNARLEEKLSKVGPDRGCSPRHRKEEAEGEE